MRAANAAGGTTWNQKSGLGAVTWQGSRDMSRDCADIRQDERKYDTLFLAATRNGNHPEMI